MEQTLLRNYRTIGQSRQVLGEHLNKLTWSYFFTGTFKDDFRKDAAVRALEKWWNNILWTKAIDRSTSGYSWFLEHHKGRDVPHIHALLLLPGCREQRLTSGWKTWFHHYGRCAIMKYDDKLGAGYYLTKYMVKENFHVGEWGIEYPVIGASPTVKTLKSNEARRWGKTWQYLPTEFPTEANLFTKEEYENPVQTVQSMELRQGKMLELQCDDKNRFDNRTQTG